MTNPEQLDVCSYCHEPVADLPDDLQSSAVVRPAQLKLSRHMLACDATLKAYTDGQVAYARQIAYRALLSDALKLANGQPI